jgi:hypothetical protein
MRPSRSVMTIETGDWSTARASLRSSAVRSATNRSRFSRCARFSASSRRRVSSSDLMRAALAVARRIAALVIGLNR